MKEDKLVSMKSSKGSTISTGEMKEPDYPWGLRITLDKEQLKALGWDKMPEIGKEKMIYAKAKVISAHMSEGEEGRHKSVELQITDMYCDKGEKSEGYEKENARADTATMLYPVE